MKIFIYSDDKENIIKKSSEALYHKALSMIEDNEELQDFFDNFDDNDYSDDYFKLLYMIRNKIDELREEKYAFDMREIEEKEEEERELAQAQSSLVPWLTIDKNNIVTSKVDQCEEMQLRYEYYSNY